MYELEPVWFVVIANSHQGWLTSCNQAGNSLGCRLQASGPVGLASYEKRKGTHAEKERVKIQGTYWLLWQELWVWSVKKEWIDKEEKMRVKESSGPIQEGMKVNKNRAENKRELSTGGMLIPAYLAGRWLKYRYFYLQSGQITQIL